MISRSGRVLVLSLLVIGGGFWPWRSQAQTAPKDPQGRPPKPITPPHRPAQEGFRLAATTGLTFIANGKYNYATAVIMPDGSTLGYSGTQRTSGGT